MDHAQGPQRFDETQFAIIEVRKFPITARERFPRAARVAAAGQQHPEVLDRGARHAIIQVDEYGPVLAPQQIAEVAITVQAQARDALGCLPLALDRVDQITRHFRIAILEFIRYEAAFENQCPGGVAEAFGREGGTDAEAAYRTDRVQPAERATEQREVRVGVELGTTPAEPGEERKAEIAVRQQRPAIEFEWHRHRKITRGQFAGKSVFLENLLVRPAPRPVEFCDERRSLRSANPVYTVLVTVEGEEPAVDVDTARAHRIEHEIGRQVCKRSRGSMGHRGILVTGGAGYIGSHAALLLRERGEHVVVLDNLSTGFREAVLDTPLIVGDVGDAALVARVLAEHDVDTVMHFAAHTIVPESVADPLKYYRNNTCATRSLLETCAHAGIGQFVFSSTAAVYGIPAGAFADETTPTAPINPYGTSKLMSEWMLRDLATASALRYVSLRYFNVAGSDPKGRIGQSTRKATLLVKVACESAVGKRPHVSIFGTDYATPDGTGVRDYIHVEDLARAHLDALDYLRAGGRSEVLNCGYGHGFSVREVLASVARVSGRALTVREEPRRAGDPPQLIARADRIRTLLGWRPALDDLDTIVGTTLAWERRLAETPWA